MLGEKGVDRLLFRAWEPRRAERPGFEDLPAQLLAERTYVTCLRDAAEMLQRQRERPRRPVADQHGVERRRQIWWRRGHQEGSLRTRPGVPGTMCRSPQKWHRASGIAPAWVAQHSTSRFSAHVHGKGTTTTSPGRSGSTSSAARARARTSLIRRSTGAVFVYGPEPESIAAMPSPRERASHRGVAARARPRRHRRRGRSRPCVRRRSSVTTLHPRCSAIRSSALAGLVP